MASNTEILIKRSFATATPANLAAGELAYSYTSNNLFIGTPDGVSALEIGGFKNFGITPNSYGSTTAIPIIRVGANGVITNISTAAISSTLNISGDTGTDAINLLTDTLGFVGASGITSAVTANTVTFNVDNTVFRANTPIVTQYIDSSVQIAGNLTVLGTETVINVDTIKVDDPLIQLAANNTSDVVDIGFIGHYFDGVQRHTGFYRHAQDKQYYLFNNYTTEPTSNVITPFSDSFVLATLRANLTANTSNVLNVLTLQNGSQLYANGNAYFANAPYLDNGATLDGNLVVNSANRLQLKNSDNSATLDLYNSGSSGSNMFYVDSNESTFDGNVTVNSITVNQVLSVSGGVFAPNIPNARTGNLVYFDTANGRFSYADDNALTPTSIANGAFSLSIQSTNGLLVHNGSGIQLANGAIIKDTSGNAVAFGENAGTLTQGTQAVAIGDSAGYNNQGAYGVAVGYGAGNVNQGQTAVAIGINAGISNQGAYGVAIGNSAGSAQGQYGIALGYDTGGSQGADSIAIGTQAGKGNTTAIGINSIAIGKFAGFESAAASSIILNASGSNLSPSTSGFFVNPIRYTETQDATYDGLAFYNSNTKEIRYSYILDGGAF
jgi:hypothetical protein